MDFEFILDENYIAYFILERKMFNESKEVESIKNKLYESNDIGYKKIINEKLLDTYSNDENMKNLFNELINKDLFNNLHLKYNKETNESLALKLLRGTIENDNTELDKIKDDLWNKYLNSYKILLNISYNPTIILSDKDVINTIQNFKETDIFKKLLNEASEYFNNVIKYWLDNKDYINNYLKSIIRYDFNVKPMVYISHPNANRGFSFDNNKIAWGHFKGIEDLNYNIVYLVHEGLHCLLPFEKDENSDECNIKHSIIELISDYELYSNLKGESTFNNGHPYLDNYKTFIYLYWLKYIGLNDEQIDERIKKHQFDINKLISIYNDNISSLNIKDFIEFCDKKYLEKNNSKNK